MASFYADNAVVNIDELTGKTGGDSYYARYGGEIVIDQDSRYGLNQTTVSSLATLSGEYIGTITVDARKVRLIPFNNGSGSIPALNTLITQGSASGKLTAVYTALNAAPLTGGAMPASGWLKIKQWNDVAYSPGALSGITADVAGADIVGWIEIVMDTASALRGNSLAENNYTGEWYEVGITTGLRASTYQIPTNGSITVVGGIWVETANGSGVFEPYPNIISAAGLTILATDAIRGQHCWITDAGVLRLGNDGTADSGYCPPVGCRIRIPNIFWQTCTTADRTINVSFSTTGSSVWATNFNIDKVSFGFALQASAVSATVTNSTFAHYFGLTSYPSPINVDNIIVGAVSTTAVQSMASANKCGGEYKNIKVACHNPSSNYMAVAEFLRAIECNYENLHLAGIMPRTSNLEAIAFKQCVDCTFTNLTLGGIGISAENNFGLSIDDIHIYDNPQGTTPSTSVSIRIALTGNWGGIKIDGVDFCGILGAEFYNRLFYLDGYGRNLTVRNIGTKSNPLDCNSMCQGLYYVNWNTVIENVKFQRCYLKNTNGTTGISKTTNSGIMGLKHESVWLDYADVVNPSNYGMSSIDCKHGLNDNYYTAFGTHFQSNYTSDTAGQFCFMFEQPSQTSSAYFELSSMVAFNGTGYIKLQAVNEYIIAEYPYWIKGFTGFQNVVPTQSGGTASGRTVYFQYDIGSGWNGTWVEATAGNLSAISGIDPEIGFRFKIKVIANTTTDFYRIAFLTTTTTAAQLLAAYPLDVSTLKINSMVSGSTVKVQKTSDSTVLYTGSSSQMDIEYAGEVRVVIRKGTGSPTYKQWDTIVTLVSDSTVEITALQELDE